MRRIAAGHLSGGPTLQPLSRRYISACADGQDSLDRFDLPSTMMSVAGMCKFLGDLGILDALCVESHHQPKLQPVAKPPPAR
jgi:hypothetical protein